MRSSGSASSHHGKLVAIEGPDGVGKSTVARAAAEAVRRAGAPVELLSFPGREPGTLGKHVYDLHHDPHRFDISELPPLSLQTLHVSAHIAAIDQRIRPALVAGRHVILDRYWWSTWVYGLVMGSRIESLEALVAFERSHWQGIRPELVVLIVPTVALRSEVDQCGFKQLGIAYRDLAQAAGTEHPVIVIENQKGIESAPDVVARILLSKGTR